MAQNLGEPKFRDGALGRGVLEFNQPADGLSLCGPGFGAESLLHIHNANAAQGELRFVSRR